LTRSYYNKHGYWYAAWVIFWSAIVLVFNGWEVFTKGHFTGANFVIAYITIPIFLVLSVGYYIWKRHPWLQPDELDMFSNIPSDEEVTHEETPPETWFGKAVNWIFT
jgi:amino acid transporter